MAATGVIITDKEVRDANAEAVRREQEGNTVSSEMFDVWKTEAANEGTSKGEAKEKSKPSNKPYKNNKEANKQAQKQGYKDAHELKDDYVEGHGSEFDMKHDKKTGEIYLENKDGTIQIPTGLYHK